jgi:bla regulator protein blaR1
MTEWLFDTLVATSMLLLFVLMVRGHVARIFGPSVAYWLWLLPAARLFMPVLTKEVVAPVGSSNPPVADIARDAALIPSGNAVETARLVEVAPSIDWIGVGLTVWLGGAALLFIVQMLRYVAMRDELLGDATEIDQIGTIRVIETDRIGGPLAFGLFRRFIAVPDHFTTTFSPQESELALAHELAHHRSGDLYANLAAFIFLCLQWFNPLAWMAWSAFRFDQEAACDARVLAGTDAQTRQSYGRALARSAAEPTPTLAMAMALNKPSTIIQRLRRLMMNDTSKRRRMTGRLAILAAAAIALPMTATVVPVFAEDKAEDGHQAKADKHKTRIILIKGKDGQNVKVDVSGDADTPFVKTIQKDGKTIVLRSNREMSDAEIEKMVEEAEESRIEADKAAAEASEAAADAEAARENAEEQRIRSVRVISDIDFANLVPEINVREVHKNCKKGQNVSTDVRGFEDGKRGSVRISVCGAGMASAIRAEAIQGLREALDDIREEEGIPEKIRSSVMNQLQGQIDTMEAQQANDGEDSGGEA